MRAVIAAPVTLALVVRAYTRKSLTPLGIVAAALTAVIHALHPSSLPFCLLVAFFLVGTTATKVKHKEKAKLTLSASGSAGGEGARTSTQVFANSGCASLLVLWHLYVYGLPSAREGDAQGCFGGPGGPGEERGLADTILLGIMANYAAVCADTLSSEMGIFARTPPVLITNPFRVVPPGTNGGVTLQGLLYGTAGAAIMALSGLALLSFCPDSPVSAVHVFLLVTALGTIGTLLDSLLGAVLQASVVDRRSGKIVEGPGGVKVLVHARPRTPSVHSSAAQATKIADEAKGAGEESRVVHSGHDLLDNNQINFLMASIVTVSGLVVGRSLLS